MTLGEQESAASTWSDDGQTRRQPGIDPVRLAVALGVFAELDELPVDHPDAVAVRRATARLYKTVKLRNRKARRDAVVANDEAVTAATATGAPGRIDDETQGIALAATTYRADRRHLGQGACVLHLQGQRTSRSTRSTTSCVRPARR